MPDTEKVTLYLTKESYPVKPNGKTVGYIQNSILHNKVSLDLKRFAEEVTINSKATKLCELPLNAKNSKNTPIVQQKVLMLDIDNENKEVDTFNIEDALKDDFIKENAAFIYETISSTEDKQKFRIVFVLHNAALVNEDIEGMYDFLIRKYPQSDSKCRETIRLFFGSNKGYILINWDNRLKMDKKISSPTPSKGKRAKTNNLKNTLKNHYLNKSIITDENSFVYNLINTNQKDAVKDRLSAKNLHYYGKTFISFNDFKQFILKSKDVSMIEILDLPDVSPFRDIFHDETDPSASVFRLAKGKDAGTELYKCFSDSEDYIGNVFQVLGRLLNISEFDSMLYLSDVLNTNIINRNDADKIKQTKENALKFSNWIKENKIQKNYPNLYNILKPREEVIYFILKDFINGDVYLNAKTDKFEMYKTISLKSISLGLKTGEFGYSPSLMSVYRTMTLISLLGFISKKVDTEIPTWLKVQLLNDKSTNNYKYRTEVYTLNNLTTYKLKQLEKIASKLITDKVVISKLDYDYIYNNFNKLTADMTFIANTSKERVVSNKTQFIEDKAIKYIAKELKQNPYISENKLIKMLFDFFRRSNKYPKMTTEDINRNLAKCRVSICSKYGLKRISLNRNNQIKYNINDIPKGKRPTVYMWDKG